MQSIVIVKFSVLYLIRGILRLTCTIGAYHFDAVNKSTVNFNEISHNEKWKPLKPMHISHLWPLSTQKSLGYYFLRISGLESRTFFSSYIGPIIQIYLHPIVWCSSQWDSNPILFTSYLNVLSAESYSVQLATNLFNRHVVLCYW